MKNLKTKIGIPLATLACFLTLGLTPVSAVVDSEGNVIKKSNDPNVVKLVNTLKETNMVLRYKRPDGKEVIFLNTRDKYGDSYLELQIIGEPNLYGNSKMVIIKDYGFDNLGGFDKICFGTKYYGVISTLNFKDLSDEAKTEIRKEYNLRVKEAPEILLNQYEKIMEEKNLSEEMEKKQFEDNILDVLTPDNTLEP